MIRNMRCINLGKIDSWNIVYNMFFIEYNG